jgi:hypothetical protein
MKVKQTKVIDSVEPLAELPEPIPEALMMDNAQPTLGEPMGIRQVARLIGCSAWSVRQTLVPSGLPHWRSGPSGKLIFYRDQVVRWLLEQQQGRRK